MMTMALKLTILSGFLVALVFHGEVEQRWVAASQPPAPLAADPVQVAQAKPIETVTATPSPSPATLPSDAPVHETSQDMAATSFAGDVLRLSAEADGVDRLWQAYKEKCGVRVSRQYDFGREWFAIWDRAAEPAIDTPGCGDSLARLRQAGDKLGRGLLRSRTTARQAGLDRGTEIGMLRWNGLQWSQFDDDHQRPRRSALPVSASNMPAEAQRSSGQVARER
jgi:hypothetical protein